jgi:6-phosphogluconolactonase
MERKIVFILISFFFILNSCDVFEKAVRPDEPPTGYKYFLYVCNNTNSIDGTIYKYEIDMSTGSLMNYVNFNLGIENSYIAISPSKKCIYSTLPSGGWRIQVYPIIGNDGSIGIPTIFNPGFATDGMLLIHPNGKFLFGSSIGSNYLFDAPISADGTLSAGFDTSSLIDSPKSFSIKPTGEFVYVINYNTDFINKYAINPATGLISTPITSADQSATGSLPQAIVIHPSLNYLYVATDNPTDTIQSYSINATTGDLTLNGGTNAINDGATCLTIDPSGNFLYCANSWTPSTISGFRINQLNGTLSALPGSPYAIDNVIGKVYYITIDPTGKYLYAPINGDNFIEGYSIDRSTGVLTHLFPLSGWSYAAPNFKNANNAVIISIKQ